MSAHTFTLCVENVYESSMADLGDYHGTFDPRLFLQERFIATPGTPDNAIRNFVLENVAKFYQTIKVPANGEGLSVLDYGCGPVIAWVISAAGLASEIVLAEYTDKNRKAVQQWLDGDPAAFDWSHYFKYVVQKLEGKSEEDVIKREKQLRKVVKAVVPCDITQDQPIEKGFEGPFDIVCNFACIETGCRTLEEYRCAIAKLDRLLKPGGTLVHFSADRTNTEGLGSYPVGTARFYVLPITREFVIATLEQNGFSDISANTLSSTSLPSDVGDAVGFTFITAVKNKE